MLKKVLIFNSYIYILFEELKHSLSFSSYIFILFSLFEELKLSLLSTPINLFNFKLKIRVYFNFFCSFKVFGLRAEKRSDFNSNISILFEELKQSLSFSSFIILNWNYGWFSTLFCIFNVFELNAEKRSDFQLLYLFCLKSWNIVWVSTLTYSFCLDCLKSWNYLCFQLLSIYFILNWKYGVIWTF